MAGLFTKVEKKKRVDYKFKIEESTVNNIDEIQDKLNKVNEILMSKGESKLAFDLNDKMNSTLKRTVSKGLKEITELYESLNGEKEETQSEPLDHNNTAAMESNNNEHQAAAVPQG